MARSARRKRKRKFYWAEIGFLILGFIGLRPSILAEILGLEPTPEPESTWNASPLNDVADIPSTQWGAAPWGQEWNTFQPPASPWPHYIAMQPPAATQPSSQPAQYQANYHPAVPQYQAAVVPQYQAPAASPWATSQWAAPSWVAAQPAPQSSSTNVAWPDAQMHQSVHHGGMVPVVSGSAPAPGTPNSATLGRY